MRKTLERDGFVFQKKVLAHLPTLEVARRIGSVLDIDKLLPSSRIPTVQSLSPRAISEATRNQYSGNYGLDFFPLHTDLAHWALPPRYFLLRCLVGTEDVFTNLLPCSYIIGIVGSAALQKAVLRTRRRRYGCSGLVRAMSPHRNEQIFRWDSIFLQPLNSRAEALKRVMIDPASSDSTIKILLRDPGDILLIDNWRMLHGRSPVPSRSADRHIERVYLSEVFNDR